ncbi:MFS transporter [Corynebacterium suicordis]
MPRVENAWKMVALAVVTVAWGGNEFTPMMVFYRGQETFSPVFVDSLLASYATGISLSLLLSGPLSDRLGRKVVMLPAPIVALVGSLLIALGESTEPLIFAGRVLSGVSIGMAMTAGGSWIKELSTTEYDPKATEGAGARRAAMSLTGGFALGSLVAGLLAEWGPMPGKLPYLIHALVSLTVILGLSRVPETRIAAHPNDRASFWADLRTPTIKHPRFLLAVVPAAPWVFGAAGVSYAVMPSLIQHEVDHPIAFSAVITAIALMLGFAIQQVSDKLDSPFSAKGQQVGLSITAVGMALAAWSAIDVGLWEVVLSSFVLGVGYGMLMVSCLSEVQRMAPPSDLGGLTAAYYVLTYVGFFFPMILTRLHEWFTYPMMLGFGAVMAVLALIVVTIFSRRFLPERVEV